MGRTSVGRDLLLGIETKQFTLRLGVYCLLTYFKLQGKAV
jgi:hypothetical protein